MGCVAGRHIPRQGCGEQNTHLHTLAFQMASHSCKTAWHRAASGGLGVQGTAKVRPPPTASSLEAPRRGLPAFVRRATGRTKGSVCEVGQDGPAPSGLTPLLVLL